MKKASKFISVLAAIFAAAGLAFGLSSCEKSQTPTDNLLSMQDVYAKAQELGFQGTLDELIAMFKGEKGDPGVQGEKGDPGVQGEKGETGAQGEKGEKATPARKVKKVKKRPRRWHKEDLRQRQRRIDH